jgi:hypothetical protein
MLFIIKSFKAIAENIILYSSSVIHSLLSLSYLIRFNSLVLAQVRAIFFKIAIKKSFAAIVPSISTSLKALAF